MRDTICAAVEIKTMTAAATVHEAKEIRDKTDEIIAITNIGSCSESDERFQRVVPTTSYRL